MTDKKKDKRRRLIAAGLGFVLGMVCNLAPPEYHVACETVISICTGHF